MAHKDAGEKLTEKELARLELKINRVYASASVDVKKELAKFRAEFSALDEQMAQMVDDGKLSEEHYKQWRLNQIGRGQRMKMMQETLASRMLNANEIATAYVNDATPSIYSLNWNYSAYVIDSIHGGVDLTLYDERTIRRLIKDSPNTMPNYPEEKAIERGIDMAYSQKVIANTVTQQILTGKTLKQMSEHLQKTFVNMELKSALRTARTSFTSAQNGGRLDCMMSAEAKGIDVKKQWFTARDNRVRDSHMEVNAEIKPLKKPFGNDLMFPADPKGRPSEVYNCRCTLLYVVDGKSVLDPMMQSPTDYEDFKNWMKDKGQPLQSPVPLPSKYKFDTFEDVGEFLKKEVGFDLIEDSLKKVDHKLLVENAKQLSKLEKMFGVVKKSRGGIGSNSGKGAVAYVSNRSTNPTLQNLSLCPSYFNKYSNLVESEKRMVESAFSMPCDPKNYSIYTVTHEYGHMLQNVFIREAYEKDGWTPETASDKMDMSKKTRKAVMKWYEKRELDTAKRCYKEIIEIAKKNNPDFSFSDNISKYGKTNYYEFFAEVFANSQCGKPNELGKAMQEWLKQKGF